MKKIKYVASTIATLLLVSSGSISYAASTTPAIYYNDKKVTTDKTPILKDGTTYVPLRVLADLFGKDINFDSKTYQINIKDKKDRSQTQTDATSSDVQQQIATLQAQVQELKDFITTVQNQTAAITPAIPSSTVLNSTTAQPTTTSSAVTVPATPAVPIADLQSILNGSDYLRIRGFQLSSINLSGDNSSVSLELDGDLKATDNNEHWTDLSQDDLKGYLGTLCAKIKQSYPNATIIGKIRNTSFVGLADTTDPTTTTQYLASFTSDPSGTLSLNKQY